MTVTLEDKVCRKILRDSQGKRMSVFEQPYITSTCTLEGNTLVVSAGEAVLGKDSWPIEELEYELAPKDVKFAALGSILVYPSGETELFVDELLDDGVDFPRPYPSDMLRNFPLFIARVPSNASSAEDMDITITKYIVEADEEES